MGRFWNNDGDDSGYNSDFHDPSNPNGNGDGDRRGTRTIVKSQCRTEEVEPGRYIRKCEKTEQIFKDCLGRPSEMVQSTKEYTEEDVTDQMVMGSLPLDPREHDTFFPGLRKDIDAIERGVFTGIGKFLEAAEEMKNEFFRSVGVPDLYDHGSSSSDKKHGIHIEAPPPEEAVPKNIPDGQIDFTGLAQDV